MDGSNFEKSELDPVVEILSVLAENDLMSSGEIAKELRIRGIDLEPRTIRYHLKKLVDFGLVEKVEGKNRLSRKGMLELKRRSVFGRLGEFSEVIEYNAYFCDFNLYSLKGVVPTDVALVDKDRWDDVVEVIKSVKDLDFLISNLVAVADEGEEMGGLYVPEGKIAIAVISNTVYDVIMRRAGISLFPEYTGLLQYENGKMRGFTELISYYGTTLSPGWLFVKSGLTSVYRCASDGRGYLLAAVRSFSRHAIEIVREEVRISENMGFGGVIEISYASGRLSLPSGNRARMVISAGLNYLAPLHEMSLNPDLRINEAFVDYREFGKPEHVLG